jgi:hypothetical protein
MAEWEKKRKNGKGNNTYIRVRMWVWVWPTSVWHCRVRYEQDQEAKESTRRNIGQSYPFVCWDIASAGRGGSHGPPGIKLMYFCIQFVSNYTSLECQRAHARPTLLLFTRSLWRLLHYPKLSNTRHSLLRIYSLNLDQSQTFLISPFSASLGRQQEQFYHLLSLETHTLLTISAYSLLTISSVRLLRILIDMLAYKDYAYYKRRQGNGQICL